MGKHPTDRGTLGTQRRVLTDGRGVPLGLAVEGAHRHDVKMTRATLTSSPLERREPTLEKPQGLGLDLDQGDDDDEVRDVLAECGLTAHIRARGEAANAIRQEAGDNARRWVVARTHRGMNRFRRLLVLWEKNACHDVAFWPMACANITYRHAGLLG